MPYASLMGFILGLVLGVGLGVLLGAYGRLRRRRAVVLEQPAASGIESLNAFPEPLALTEGGRIVFCNSAFSREIPELAHEGSWSAWMSCCFDVPADTEPPPLRVEHYGLRGDLQLRTRNGVLIHWTAVPFPGYGRKLVLNIVRDVTQWASRDYDNALFMNKAAHELKTPVTAIKGYAELMQLLVKGGRPVSPDIADRIVEQSDRLTHLVNQLLDVARIGAGRLSDEPETVELADTLTAAIERLRRQFPGHVIDAELRAHPRIIIDPLRFEQVVREFVVNAVKYSPPERPVTVRLFEQDDGLVLEVEDQGIGIPAPEQARIYDRFVRASNVTAVKGSGGFGLGLYIAREIVTRWHGEITLESDVDRGTRVRVWWPPRLPHHEREMGDEAAARPALGRDLDRR